MAARLGAATAAALCLGGGGGASSAAKPAPRIPDWKQSHFEEANPGVRSAYILAVCTRNHRRQAAEALLATSPGSPEEAALLPQAVPSGWTECPIRRGRTTIRSEIFMRGAVAEAIYNGDRTRPRSGALPFDESFPESGHGNRLMVARWVARCSVRRDPRGAHAILQFSAGAVSERRAMRALGPTFTACLPSGESLQISRLKFRAMIAEELYRASLSFKESFAHGHG